MSQTQSTNAQAPNGETVLAPYQPPKAGDRSNVLTSKPDAMAYMHNTAVLDHFYKLATIVSQSNTLPEHLRKGQNPVMNVMRLVIQANRWGLDVYAVCDKTYNVKGKLGFEGQLVNAILNSSGQLTKRLDYAFEGDGDDMTVTVTGRLQGDEKDRTIAVAVRDVKTDNAMWKGSRTAREQKLSYNGVLWWARRHCPEVVQGFVTRDDIEAEALHAPDPMAPAVSNLDDLKAAMVADKREEPDTNTVDAESTPVDEKPETKGDKPSEASKTADASKTEQTATPGDKGQTGLFEEGEADEPETEQAETPQPTIKDIIGECADSLLSAKTKTRVNRIRAAYLCRNEDPEYLDAINQMCDERSADIAAKK